MIELAIGDAYGAAFEYVKPEHIRTFHTLAGYARHPRHGLVPGSYTDDTQMSVALAEVLLDEPSWNRQAFAERFVCAFKRDPRDGYARGFQKLLEGIADGTSFLHEIRPDSDKSGAGEWALRPGFPPLPRPQAARKVRLRAQGVGGKRTEDA